MNNSRKLYTLEIIDGVAKGKEVNPFGEKQPNLVYWIGPTGSCNNKFEVEAWLQAEQSRKSFVIEEMPLIGFELNNPLRVVSFIGHDPVLQIYENQKFTAELNADNKIFNIEIL